MVSLTSVPLRTALFHFLWFMWSFYFCSSRFLTGDLLLYSFQKSFCPKRSYRFPTHSYKSLSPATSFILSKMLFSLRRSKSLWKVVKISLSLLESPSNSVSLLVEELLCRVRKHDQKWHWLLQWSWMSEEGREVKNVFTGTSVTRIFVTNYLVFTSAPLCDCTPGR